MAFLTTVYEWVANPYSKYKTITTMELKDILDTLPNTPQKSLFFGEVPKSNYSTTLGTTGAQGAGCFPLVYTINRHVKSSYKSFYSDNLTILQHINVTNLNGNCFLGLSEYQWLLLQELRK
jgi:hypothetical protein